MTGGATYAADQNPSPDFVSPPVQDYAYPFDEARLARQLSSRRHVVELFTSFDCLFCPKAEKLLADLADKTAAITLACHADPEGEAYPLAQEFCTRRQSLYTARLSDGLLYTPQMVINGRVEAAGHDFDDMRDALVRALPDDIRPIKIRPGADKNILAADIPSIDLGGGNTADIFMITYRTPYRVPDTIRQSITHKHALIRVEKSFVSLGGWDGRAKTLTIPFTPAADEGGFVLLVQRGDGVILAAQDVPAVK